MKPVILAATAVMTLAVAGCETMSQTECLSGDWSGVGFKDGQAGYPTKRLDDHAKACMAHGVSPNVDLYMQGRESGLRMYCTPAGGFEAGRKGKTYENVCPPDAEQGFMAAYNDGRVVYRVESALSSADYDITSAENRIREKENDIRYVENELRAPNLTPEQLRELRDRRDRLRSERDDSERDARDARDRLRRARYDLDQVHRDLSPIYGPW